MDTDTPATCPKCNQAMEEGFILDAAHLNVGHVSRWVQGSPAVSFFFDMNTSGREQHPIQSFRCVGCGYLESFARMY